MRKLIKTLITTAFIFSLGMPAQAALPQQLEAVIAQAKARHAEDYIKLQRLEDLSPENYLKARVQKPTAARAMKRLNLHEGVLLEALLKPSLHLVAAQDFPAHMSENQRAHWQGLVLQALQLGAAASLTHQQSPHAEMALAISLTSEDYKSIRPPLCVFYGRIARHAQGVARLKAIAQTSTGLVQESAIIGLGKTRELSAFYVLETLLTQSSGTVIEKTVLHAMGHLANRAAQKANPMQHDDLVRAKVRTALVSRIDRATALPHEHVALSSLSLVLTKNEFGPVATQLDQTRVRKLVTPMFSRIQKRSLRR